MSANGRSDRRSFLQKSGMALLGSSMALNLVQPQNAFARSTNTLKVGLVGCGGRGSGAAMQALQADANTVLTAVGDVFPEQIEVSLRELSETFPDRVKVSKDKQFLGFDAYKKVIESDVDVVLLATPPAFRPEHFEAAINAGKHVFAEKPVAIDAPGVRKVIEAGRKARDKNLSVVSGFCYRYEYAKREFYRRLAGGQIGDILAVSTTRNGGQLWSKKKLIWNTG
jgi:myo-inositol 2-dehydrogenase/D-chiro-inositol 1-dehydrogenase